MGGFSEGKKKNKKVQKDIFLCCGQESKEARIEKKHGLFYNSSG